MTQDLRRPGASILFSLPRHRGARFAAPDPSDIAGVSRRLFKSRGSLRLSPVVVWALLGVIAVPCAGFVISLAIACISTVAYFADLGRPDGELALFARQVSALLERAGMWSVAISLVGIARWASGHVRLRTCVAVAALASAAWVAGLPLRHSEGPLLASTLVRSGMQWSLYLSAGRLGVAWGRGRRRAALHQLRVTRRIRRARSPEAVVQAIASFAFPGRLRVALFEASTHRIGADTQLRLIADAGPGPRIDERIDIARLPELKALRYSPTLRLRRTRALSLSWPGDERFLVCFAIVNADGPSGVLILGTSRRRVFRRLRSVHCQSLVEQAAAAWREQRLLDVAQRSGRQREQLRVAHRIHDTLAQDLISARMYLDLARPDGTAEEGVRRSAWHEANRIVGSALDDARRLAWEYHEAAIEKSALAKALSTEVSRCSHALGIEARFDHEGVESRVETEIADLCLDAVREAMRNARKHARTDRVYVTLTTLPDRIALDVVDRGRGVRPELRASGEPGRFGLRALRERVESHGGQLLFESVPGEGATLSIWIPCRHGSRA